MRPHDELLYLCCVQGMGEDHQARVAQLACQPDLPWAEVFTLARDHGVAPLVYHNLQQADAARHVPAVVTRSFELATYTNKLAKALAADKLAKALAFLDAHGIDALGIKAVALDRLVYDQPWYTSALDIDLVLRPRVPPLAEETRAAVKRRWSGTGVEYEFGQHHDLTLNGLLPVDFAVIWRDTSTVDIDGHTLYLMRPEDMLLSVCINSARKRYFRLRSLADLAATLARYPQMDWRVVAGRAHAWSCSAIVYAALAALEQTTGCLLPAGARSLLRVAPARRWLLERAIVRLTHFVPLSAMSFHAGDMLIESRLSWSLALTYGAYRPRQAWRVLHRVPASLNMRA